MYIKVYFTLPCINQGNFDLFYQNFSGISERLLLAFAS